MNASTHALIGIAAGLIISAQAAAPPSTKLAMAVICGVAALLPDVDHPNSTVRNKLGIAGAVAFGWMRHRGLSHSAAAVALIAVGLALLGAPSIIIMIVATGYASHIAADALTPAGVPLLAPLLWQRWRLPLVRTGGVREWLLRGALVALCLWLVSQR